MKKKFLYFGLFLGFLLIPQFADAAPANPEMFTFEQPSGETFQAQTKGDETFNYVVTDEGDIVSQGEDGFWHYTQKSNARNAMLLPFLSGAKAGIDDPPINAVDEETLLKTSTESELIVESVEKQVMLKSDEKREHTILVLLVEFEDVKLTYSDADWQSLIFGDAAPSLKDYYSSTTNNKIDVLSAKETNGTANDGIVRVMLDRKHPNTGSSITTANQEITRSALEKADQYIDYKEYDTNGNGRIETDELHFMVIIAGQEQSYGDVSEPTVWGHRWALNSLRVTLDNTVLDYFTQFGEKHAARQATLGIIAHEFGHDIGLPDLYNVGMTGDDGVQIKEGSGLGYTSIMASGSWGAKPGEESGTTPVGLDAYSKSLLGMDVETITTSTFGKQLQTLEEGEPTVLKIDSSNLKEYFLIENRQLSGYDAGMKRGNAVHSGGVAIYRIDKNYDKNYTAGKQLVTNVEADEGIRGYSYYKSGGIWNADPFYYSGEGVHKQSQQIMLDSDTVPSTTISTGEKEYFSLKVKSDAQTKMNVDILIGDDHSGDWNDFDSMTLLEPGKTIPFVTDYTHDWDYFKLENLSGYYALTVTFTEGLPANSYPYYAFYNEDSGSYWGSYDNQGISYVSEDDQSYTIFFKVTAAHKLKGRIEYFNHKTNIQSAFMVEGMKGTLRLEEVPANMYSVTAPEKLAMEIGESITLEDNWVVPEQLKHIPFSEIYTYQSASEAIAAVDNKTVKAVKSGVTNVTLVPNVTTTTDAKIRKSGNMKLPFEKSISVTVKDDHSGDWNDFDSMTLLEPGKTIPFVTDYTHDWDYFKLENLSGYYALTVTFTEGLPANSYPYYAFYNEDSGSYWGGYDNQGISYVSEDDHSYTIFFKVTAAHKLKGRIEHFNHKTNIQSAFMVEGMKGTLRLEEIPADMYSLTLPVQSVMNTGEVFTIEDSWSVPEELSHIPFSEIYSYSFSNEGAAIVENNTIKAVESGRITLKLTPNVLTSADAKIRKRGNMLLPFEKNHVITIN